MKRQGVTDLRGAVLAARLGLSEEQVLVAMDGIDDLPDDPWFAKADSPLERLFLAALVRSPSHRTSDADWNEKLPALHFLGNWRVILQESLGGHTVDLYLIGGDGGELAVELDGHDYHERTKEQAARDRKKDRDLLRSGVPVVRFTGSEVYRDPDGCVEELTECLQAITTQAQEAHENSTCYHGQEIQDARFAQCAYDVSRTAVLLRSLGHFDRADSHEESSRKLWSRVCFKSTYGGLFAECAYP
jgi:very-short-patch-repair endonuclease